MKQDDTISIIDFCVILFRRKWVVIGIWLLAIVAAFAYLKLGDKTYRLGGAIYVGRFQEILLEEGEYVAQRLKDYSFIKTALENGNVELDVPVTRLQKDIDAKVINEVRKVKDVGIVYLTVEYGDPEICHQIFKALTDQLIADHAKLLDQSQEVFRKLETRFAETEGEVEAWLRADEAFLAENLKNPPKSQEWPSHLLARFAMAQKSDFVKQIVKDRAYLLIEADSATKSFNTKLSAEPKVPDHPIKPIPIIILMVAAVLGAIFGAAAAFALEIYQSQIKPRLA